MSLFVLSRNAFFVLSLFSLSLSNALWASTYVLSPTFDRNFASSYLSNFAEDIQPKKLSWGGEALDAISLPRLDYEVPYDEDPVGNEENQEPNVVGMAFHNSKDALPDPDPLSYLRSMLNQTQVVGVNANAHNLRFLKEHTLFAILSRIGQYGAHRLTQEEHNLVAFCGSSVDELQDMWSTERTVDISFLSPKKSMKRGRVDLTTPLGRRVMGRRALAECTGVRSRLDMEDTRQTYYRELEEYLTFKLQENARLQAEAIAGAVNCGLTRAGVQEEAAFLRQGLTGEMVRTFATWVEETGMNKDLRAEMTSHFLGKLTTYLVQFHFDNPERLQFFFNPQDIDLSAVDTMGRTNLQRLQAGLNPLGFELHHLTQRQNPGDVIWYLPAEAHKIDGLHAYNEHGSHMDDLARADFNRIRKEANQALYKIAVSYSHLFAG